MPTYVQCRSAWNGRNRFVRFCLILVLQQSIKKAQIYKPKLSEKQRKMAVLDFTDRLQCRYTIAQHQPQIMVAHSKASGNSDVATFPLAEKWLILKRIYFVVFSLTASSRVFWYQIWRCGDFLNLVTGDFPGDIYDGRHYITCITVVVDAAFP